MVNDAVVSNKHLRIYTIIFDPDQSDGIAPLVYAEDLSRNGTYWNGSLIGKGNGGILLSDGDTLRVSPRVCYHFHQMSPQNQEQPFDLTQECEMKVGGHVQTSLWALIRFSFSKRSTMSLIENWAPEPVVRSSWLSINHDAFNLHARLWTSAD